MKKLERGIVFSNDIERILKGKNAIDYNYQENGFILPEKSFIKRLREDFKRDVSRIFNGESTIIEEEEMLFAMIDSIRDVYGRVPHHILG